MPVLPRRGTGRCYVVPPMRARPRQARAGAGAGARAAGDHAADDGRDGRHRERADAAGAGARADPRERDRCRYALRIDGGIHDQMGLSRDPRVDRARNHVDLCWRRARDPGRRPLAARLSDTSGMSRPKKTAPKRGYSREFSPRARTGKRYLLDEIPAGLWIAIRAKARREGTSMRALILRLL